MTNRALTSLNAYASACDPYTYVMNGATTTWYSAMATHCTTVEGYETMGLNTLNVDSELQTKAAVSIKREATNLANMLGEYRQAATLFGDLSRDVARLTFAAIKKDPRLLKVPRNQWSKATAQRYLQYTYGISPLLDDMHGCLKALRERLESRDTVHPVEVRVVRTEESEKISPSKASSLSFFQVFQRATGRFVSKLKGFYVLKNEELLKAMGQHGVTNPLGVAWELTPFSFVIDWWCSVGDVLSTLDNLLYVRSSSGTIITRCSYVTTRQCAGGVNWVTAATYNRRAIAPATVASLYYKESASARHIANGLALFRVLRR